MAREPGADVLCGGFDGVVGVSNSATGGLRVAAACGRWWLAGAAGTCEAVQRLASEGLLVAALTADQRPFQQASAAVTDPRVHPVPGQTGKPCFTEMELLHSSE